MAEHPEGYLLTRGYTADRAIFVNEDDIISTLHTTYSAYPGMVVDKVSRDVYVVRYTKEDVVQNDVFTVQRVPIYAAPTHL